MKRKGLTIGLLLIVASIWGAVLSKFWRPNREELGTSSDVLMPMDDDAVVIDSLPPTASLGNYRDPFLEPSQTRPLAGAVTPHGRKPEIPVETWPRIVFNGLLRNAANSRAVALLNVDGRDAMFVQGVAGPCGLKVIKVNSDSVLVALNNRVRSFRR
jgi:hypothetical protein